MIKALIQLGNGIILSMNFATQLQEGPWLNTQVLEQSVGWMWTQTSGIGTGNKQQYQWLILGPQ